MIEDKVVTRFSGNTQGAEIETCKITSDNLHGEYAYDLATKALKKMFMAGVITKGEFNKIDAKNRQTFSPHLADLMPENR